MGEVLIRALAEMEAYTGNWPGQAAIRLCNMAYAAGWLILAVLILRVLLKRAPKWLSCLLWALVAVKLICPVTIESVFSLIPSSEPLPQQIITENTFRVNTGVGAVDAPVNDYLGDHYYEGVTVPADNASHVMYLLGLIWMAGLLLLLLFNFISYCKLYRLTRARLCVEDGVFMCDAIDTPFILGIVCPRIYLPSAMEKRQAAYVIAHEKAHMARKDYLWKPLGFLILSVYWFQPLCWLSYILFCRDMEAACDERVLGEMGEESRKPYAHALLSCSVRQPRVWACPLAFGEVGVKERIKHVLNYRKPALWVIAAAVVCCAAAAVCFLTSPKKENAENNSGDNAFARICANQYVKECFLAVKGSAADYDYTDWRIGSLDYCDTCEAEGKSYGIYRLNYEFLSASPEQVVLAGGMEMTEDGWVLPGYRDSTYLVFENTGEELRFVTALTENDCYPGDEMFTADLLLAISETADDEKTAAEHADTAEPDDREEDRKELLSRWQMAFCARDGEAIAEMVTPELAEELLEGSAGYYSFGVSSPWPWEGTSGAVLYDYDGEGAVIYYYAMTSDPHVTCWREELAYTWEDNRYVITEETLTYYDNISTAAEYEEAYRYIDGTMMDYTANGLGESLNENALLSGSMAYRALFEPKSAAAFLLNLSDDTSKVQFALHEPEGSGQIGLDIIFPKEQKKFTISMVQPFGEHGIWVPADYRIDIIARMRKANSKQLKKLPFQPDDIPDMSGILCIGEIPGKNIRVYGYNDEETAGYGVIIEVNGDIYYYDWYYTSSRAILPELYWDEARERLQMSCSIYTGTGVAAQELHILQRYGTMQDTSFSLDDYSALLEERIGWNFAEDTRILTLTDKKTGETLAEAAVPAEAGERVTGLELGMISRFELGEELRFVVEPGYYMDGGPGIAWYEKMPVLEFELAITDGKNGHLDFALGDSVTIP